MFCEMYTTLEWKIENFVHEFWNPHGLEIFVLNESNIQRIYVSL